MEPNRHLGGYLRAISNAMSRNMQQNAEQLGLTSTQGMFLHHIWFRQEQQGLLTYARDLEEFFDVKHPTVSGILQRMETAGFIRFEASKTDHRRKSIHLTEQAMEVHSHTELHIRQTEARLVSGMTDTEVQEFRRLLQIAAANLNVCEPCPIHPKEVTHL